jgi:PAS domain S-box-containing protein
MDSPPLRLLIVEDNPADAELLVRSLRQAGYQPDWTRVETEPEYLDRLNDSLDLVLCDFALPAFNGLRAVELLRERGLDVPIILVSGTIGEETAVAAMKLGATDYLLKDRLARLGPAAEHAISEHRLRRDRRRADEALRLAHAQLGQLLEQSPAVLYALKLDGSRTSPYLISENVRTLLGFTAAEASAPDWWLGQLHPDDRSIGLAMPAATAATGSSRTEYRLRHQDGQYRWVEDNQRLIHYASDGSTGLIGSLTDITERRRADEVVRQASGHLARNRQDRVRLELAIFGLVVLAALAVGFHLTGLADAIREVFAQHPERLGGTILAMAVIIFGLGIFAFRRWRETQSELLSNRQIQAGLGLLHAELDRQVKRRTEELATANQSLQNDIAERKRAELALTESEARFRELAETVQEVFWVTNSETNRILYVSPAYVKIWGRTCESLYESPGTWLDAIHPEDRSRIWQATTTKQAHGSYDEEYRITRPDGSERWIHDRAFPVRAHGRLLRMVGVAEDITDAKKLGEQLLRAQRMEAIGTLAGGVAHDLNNILAPMLMVPALLRPALPHEPDQRLVDLIEKSAQRGANVVRQLLTFSRGTGGERVTVQLRHLFKEMVGIMHETFPRDIAVDYHAAPELRPVRGDPTQLHQVLLNLCVNARDAMPQGGKLSLTARDADLGEADVRDHPPAAAGLYVAIEVADTGQGIPPAIIDRIFDPFFTTKGPAKGTGLGLSTVLGIVRSHGGFVTVASRPGLGATFTLFLPASAEDAASAAAPEAEAIPQGSGELILLVDDEDSIRASTRLALEHHRYRVLTANDGAEALVTFMQHRDEIRLVVTDVMMPVMGGVALIRALHSIAPDFRIIATSGLNDLATANELQAAGIGGILGKPYGARELLEAIHDQLSPRA